MIDLPPRWGGSRAVVFALLLAGARQPVQATPPTLADLVQMKSIDSVSISPDGNEVAYRLLSPVLDANRTTAQWFIASVRGGTQPIALGIPLDPIVMAEFDVPFEGVAYWMPGPGNLAVLAQRDSQKQVWEVSAARGMRQLTRDSADVESFQISADGRRLRYQVRNPIFVITAAQNREEIQGVHFDRSVFAEGLRLTRNFRIGDRETTVRREGPSGIVDLGVQYGRGTLRSKTIELRRHMKPEGRAAGRQSPRPAVLTPDARTISWVSPGSVLSYRSPADNEDAAAGLEILRPSAPPLVCPSALCQSGSSDIREAFVLKGSGEVVFLSERHSTGRTGIYGWVPVNGRIRTILAPTGSLSGGTKFGAGPCPVVGGAFICVQEAATLPPRLVRVDIKDGSVEVLADPNRKLAMKSFPTPRFIEWDDAGQRANGVLLLPAVPGAHMPLVITTYNCRGFLHGGTGMAVPEFLLVMHGIAALCVNYDDRWDDQRGSAGTPIPAGAARAAASSYISAIQKLAEDGLIDAGRVGIAGHSLGANAVAYAISHSDAFAAAMMSTGTTFDPMSYALTAPTADNWRNSVYSGQGLPVPYDASSAIAQKISPALNAFNIRAAVLFQPPENEWLLALQLYSAIQHHGGVADMYIYPDAGHDPNLLPSDHYWRNLRALDWFDYWLRLAPGAPPRTLAGFNALEERRSLENDLRQ